MVPFWSSLGLTQRWELGWEGEEQRQFPVGTPCMKGPAEAWTISEQRGDKKAWPGVPAKALDE